LLFHTSLLTSTLLGKDSDVLVYSAACHVPFPILFKLDRSSGQCDVISMEWLLSPPPDDPNNMNKGSVLEILLKNLASRQARRPGFGVRLFVQACVLAGCDYAPNQLSGVGLVNAFKFVRDNAHRNDSVRFEKVLASLPRKARADLDLKEYELILAKSEAVFYYHLIRNQKGQVKPLSSPRISDQENGDAHHFSDHSPFLNRFDGDWSFLGRFEDTAKEGAPRGACCSSDDAPPVTEVLVAKRRDVVTKRLRPSITPTSKVDPERSTKRVAVEVHNPYRVAKKPKEDNRRPLGSFSPNTLHGQQKVKDNPFAKFASGSDTQSGPKESAMANYLVKKDDVRFVKRQFPSASSAMQHLKSKASTSRRRLFSLQGSFTKQIPLALSAPHGAKHTAPKTAAMSLKKSHGGNYDSSQDDELRSFEYELSEKKTKGPLPSNEIPRLLCQASKENWSPEMVPSVEADSEEDARPPRISTVSNFDCGCSGNDFAYPVDPPNQSFPTEARPQQPDADFFDLTDSNSGHAAAADSNFQLSNIPAESQELSSRSDPEQSYYQESSTSVGQTDCARNEFDTEDTITIDRREILVGDFTLPHLELDPKESADTPASAHAASTDTNTQSKYFTKKDRSRRVTLDPSEEAGMLTSTMNRSKKGRGNSRICSVPFVVESKVDTISPEAKDPFWNQDEIVESPELDDAQQTTSRFAQRATKLSLSRTSSSSSSRMHRGGALVSAFQRQEQLSATQSSRPASSFTNDPFPRKGGKNSKKQSVRPSAENFFKPAIQRQRASIFSQLEINVREPVDDF
jgi:hypothetical protein